MMSHNQSYKLIEVDQVKSENFFVATAFWVGVAFMSWCE